ncbi:MAG TPA: antitoxin [Ruminiclostridium sp.]|nr:antitoxin [Ruminiclostridium sp.]
MGKATTKAKDKYNAKAYEDIRLRVKNGEKTPIEAAAKAASMSTNAYILQAIKEKMERSQ